MLYKSSVLLYDHQTESIWSQLLNKAIAGPLVANKLKPIKSTRTSFKAWRKKHPDTLVLSSDTGYRRNYSNDPYKGYVRAGSLWFSVGKVRKDLKAMEMILGIELDGHAKAYPVSQLKKKPGTHKDKIGSMGVQIMVDQDGEVADVTDDKGSPLNHLFGFWFAWQAAHPKTAVYKN